MRRASDLTADVVGLVVAALVVGGFFWAALASAQWKCERAWADSGMHSRWVWGAGCLVEASPGRWIPADRLREFPTPEVIK